MSLRILLSGASGVIGRLIADLAAADDDVEIVGQATSRHDFEAGQDADVVIDFSHPELCMRSLDHALEKSLPIVIGTTGLESSQQDRIREASIRIAVCQAANFSPGVNLLMRLAGEAARTLGEDFDLEVLETHHRRKIDAPSGTALALGQALARGRGLDPGASAVFDRSAGREPRKPGQIGYQAIRGGDIPGEHTVFLLGDAERLELTHRASDRSIFARGAVLAARRIIGKPAGMHEFADLMMSKDNGGKKV